MGLPTLSAFGAGIAISCDGVTTAPLPRPLPCALAAALPASKKLTTISSAKAARFGVKTLEFMQSLLCYRSWLVKHETSRILHKASGSICLPGRSQGTQNYPGNLHLDLRISYLGQPCMQLRCASLAARSHAARAEPVSPRQARIACLCARLQSLMHCLRACFSARFVDFDAFAGFGGFAGFAGFGGGAGRAVSCDGGATEPPLPRPLPCALAAALPASKKLTRTSSARATRFSGKIHEFMHYLPGS